MRSVNLKRFIGLMLAFVFCVGGAYPEMNSNYADASASGGYIVRVGMYVDTTTDSRLFSAKTESANGFDIGYSDGTSFHKLFSIGHTTIFILPLVNARFDTSTGSCTPAEDGNIGAYSSVAGTYSGYVEAAQKARISGGFVSISDKGYEVRTNPSNYGTEGEKSGLMLLDAQGNILLTFTDTARKFALRGSNGASVSFPMVHRTGSIDTYAYNGFFEYSLSGGRLFMVNCIDIEDYTKCVMANEIGTNVSVETRKAFSVLARTVPLAKKHGDDGFDVCCNSSCCQVYNGLHQISAENNQIVDATRGLYCAYNGSPISVLYHNSNGGASCSSVAAWGGDEIPYLTTVFLDEQSESDVWELEFTKQEFYEYMASRREFSALTDADISMEILEKDPYGSDYVTVLSVSDGSGNNIEVRTSEDVRSACGFDSANFEFEYVDEITVVSGDGSTKKCTINGIMTADGYKKFESFGDEYITTAGEIIAPEKIIIRGEGAGHGVGFSAIGSEQLAADGYSYEYILQFFFSGTTLQNIG